jgi:hypothetical protein
MEINHIYKEVELKKSGFESGKGIATNVVFKKEDKVYFFEEIKKGELRLHSIINKRSFYM